MSASAENILLQEIEPIDGSSANREVSPIAHDEPGPNTANLLSVFGHATALQICTLVGSALCAILSGAAMPLVTVVFGALADGFINGDNKSPEYSIHKTQHLAVILVLIAIGSFITTLLSTWGFNAVGEQLTRQLQRDLLDSVMHQNMAYFDYAGTGQLISHLDQDMKLIQDGISQKASDIISGVSGTAIALACAFITNRRFASILVSQPISLVTLVGFMGFWLSKIQRKGANHSARANDLAQEVLGAMRNVITYRSQDRYARKYCTNLEYPSKLDYQERLIFGVVVAGSFTILHWSNGLGIWQAERLIGLGQCTISEVLTVLYATTVAGAMLCQALPFVVSITNANGAACRVFSVVRGVPDVRPSKDKCLQPDLATGAIRFDEVSFAYPSRSEHLVLDNVSFEVPAGGTVALIGPSGSGKSTIFALIEQLYYPSTGRIMIGNNPIEEMDVIWLRSQIGYVSQDVTLFNTTIHSNIANGLSQNAQEALDEKSIQQLVVEAAKIACIHSCITNMPQGYATVIGANGSRLSGGQRQRLAIARAVVSKPAIMLLDEATSALDSQCEHDVHKALESATSGRTTIIIAHRLSTIRNADSIIIMQGGKILNQGSDTQLMQNYPLYQALIQQQELGYVEREQIGTSVEVTQGKKSQKEASVSIDNVAGADGIPSVVQLGSSISRIWALNYPEILFTSTGIFLSVLAGATYPIQAIFFGGGIMSLVNPSLSTGGHSPNFWAKIYLVHGFIVLSIYCLRGFCFAVSASKLSFRARSELFNALLSKNLPFFEEDEHSTGALVSILSSDTAKVVGVSGTSLGLVTESTTMLLTGVLIGCLFGWKIGLAATATVPLVAASGFLQYHIVTKVENFVRRDIRAVAIAHEALTAIRTVTVFGLHQSVMESFQGAIEQDSQSRYWAISAAMYACTTSLRIFSIAFVFWFGGTHLIATGEYTIQQFFICFAATVWGTQSAATLLSRAPDIAGAHSSAQRVNILMEAQATHRSEIPASGMPLPLPKTTQELAFHQVSFKYPKQPDQLVLDNFSFKAPAGSFVAVVGCTGSGKSSVINLIERFYTYESGQVTLSNTPIDRYSLDSYRSYYSLVDQNPCLIGNDLRDCLQSGGHFFSDDEIYSILKAVGLKDFLMSLPQGLSTLVTGNGSTLSGGQRQRMAIAKALLLRPNILLLDEATSALDVASEQIVQKAIKDMMRYRTIIAITHRLNTIVDADEILVVDCGRIIERGTHEGLMGMEGRYWQMARLQQLGGTT